MQSDRRSKKVAAIVHCILNQNSRVYGLAHYPAMVDEIVNLLQKHHIGVMQMPCPELTYAGVNREPRTREGYNTPKFRKHCKKIAISIANQVQAYLENDFQILTVLGVAGSPSCATSEPRGILIEELKQQLEKRNVTVPMLEIEHENVQENIEQLEKILTT
ncbi:MAG: hypothetical protein U9O89_04215 [Thermoproteota archaeon]|nr:hypothetical protein [Thermoproteota archaeon]